MSVGRLQLRALRVLLAVALLSAGSVAIGGPARAEGGPVERDSIFISKNSEFNPANGVIKGTGTASDPYVISGWKVSQLQIKDTSAHVVIKNNEITDVAVLDWIGHGSMVMNNTINDLRVNQNVERTGDATSGMIMDNTFGIVGQLRHFDGVFENNVVTGEGTFSNLPFFDDRVVNFDGFDGAHFRNNDIRNGYVEVRLHGHHYGTAYGAPSHHYGHMGMMTDADQAQRYHEVWITHNKITAPNSQFALVYTDTSHAGNDRTAPSETDEALNGMHVHHTRVHFVGNKLIGSGIQVNVFNADDEHHLGTARGLMEIRNNTIQLSQPADAMPWESRNGITVQQAKDVTLKVAHNSITAPERNALMDGSSQSGIWLWQIEKSDLYFMGNTITNPVYGVRAQEMPNSVHWWIKGLNARAVDYPVYYDNSVKNAPKRTP